LNLTLGLPPAQVLEYSAKEERGIMNEQPEEQNPEKVELTYMGDPPPEAGDDIYSYKYMVLTESRWAWAKSGWKMVGGWVIVTFVCIGCWLLLLVMDRGWDGLLVLMGWK
jgi:hypothetical protein